MKLYFHNIIFCVLFVHYIGSASKTIRGRGRITIKNKASFEELYDKIADRGITFNSKSKEEVISILKEKNYYYRLISYRKNFNKKNEKYVGLDFDCLIDLASIDTYLREFLLSLCLDVEHTAKTLLMTHITENGKEDGYKVVEDFKKEFPKAYEKSLKHFEKNMYKKEMFHKRKDISIWVFLEIIDFGTFLMLLKSYAKKYPDILKDLKPDIMKYTKNIRNACAHNDVFFINIFSHATKIKAPQARMTSFAKLMGVKRKEITHNKVHDIVALIYYHQKICSDGLNNRRVKEGERLLQRVCKNIKLYSNCLPYHYFFNFMSKGIAYMGKK